MKTLILGNVITADDNNPNAEAIVCSDGIIEYVGSKLEAEKLCGSDVKVLDYTNKYIYPGFLEGHAHGYFAGFRKVGQIDLTYAFDNKEKMQEIMKQYVLLHPMKNMFMACGWNETTGPLDHTFLDEVCIDKPFVLNTSGGHSVLLNKKAMEYYKIDKEAVKKWGSDLVWVDENGEPTGYLCEAPAVKIAGSFGQTKEAAKEYINCWQRIAFENGITGYIDAGTELLYKGTNEAIDELNKEDKLKIYTFAYSIVNGDVEKPEEAVDKIVEMKKKYENKHFFICGVKVFLDGVAEAKTSWTVDGLAEDPNYKGNIRFSSEELMVRLLNAASKNNMSLHTHSEGDGATRFMLNCIEKSQQETGNTDQRNALAHLHFVKPEELDKMAKTNSIPVVPPLWVAKFLDGYEVEAKNYGRQRADDAYPIKSFFDRGCKVIYHTDFPISPMLDISRAFYMAERRALPEPEFGGLEKTQRNIKESVDRKSSLEAMTINVAYALKLEDKLGSIEKNKIANFSVFDINFLTEDIDKVFGNKAYATIIDGEEVYRIQ